MAVGFEAQHHHARCEPSGWEAQGLGLPVEGGLAGGRGVDGGFYLACAGDGAGGEEGCA